MKKIKTIDDVLLTLDNIVQECITTQNPVGVFVAVYRAVTAKVKEGIAAGRFEDGVRMEQFDVAFALRFIDAWHAHANNKTTTNSWKLAFDAEQREYLYHIQHLFLAMNAHINLDLGIAAATVSPGDSLETLTSDFMEMNKLLSEMTEEVQEKLSKMSPLMAWLDKAARSRDEQIAGFSLSKARDHAWNVANLLAPIPSGQWSPVIAGIDKQIAKLGTLIVRPSGFLWRMAYRFVDWLEKKETGEVIKNLL